MNFTVLSFLACLVADVEKCETIEIRMSSDQVNVMQCERVSQAILASWIATHQNYRIMGRVKCSMETDRKFNI